MKQLTFDDFTFVEDAPKYTFYRVIKGNAEISLLHYKEENGGCWSGGVRSRVTNQPQYSTSIDGTDRTLEGTLKTLNAYIEKHLISSRSQHKNMLRQGRIKDHHIVDLSWND